MELQNNIITAWQLSEVASKAEGEDKEHAIQSLDNFLIGKEDRAYLDFHETLGSLYLKVGEKEKAIERYRIYAKISPNMVSTFDDAFRADVLG
ncbi:MAG: hypothetical protein KAR03_02715 [Candidatus Thorarchaeota archaeon]|nr:hypothetical protein [Candidatus Thorarchaeota archaeon]